MPENIGFDAKKKGKNGLKAKMKYVRHIYWLILIRNSVGSFEMYHRRRFSHVKIYSIFSSIAASSQKK